MKIGILSDSHKDTKNTKEFIEHLKNNGATHLVHAGDFEIVENLESLHGANLPYVSVFGNNDIKLLEYQSSFNIHREPHYFLVKDIKFKLMHLPYYLAKDDAHIVVYGHTHQVSIEYNNKTLILNPGEICARESGKHEALMLKIDEKTYTVTHYYRYKNEKEIRERTMEFLR
ncbi:MAG: uncharacterized protein QG567_1974 [Campylobacterota bacterium]|nr:uncharacterized protein [Campylobacterota bacterium]